MKTNNLSLKRITLLMNHDIQYFGRPALIVLLSLFSILIVFFYVKASNLMSNYGINGNYDNPINLFYYRLHLYAFIQYVVLGGTFAGALSFREMRSKNSREHYLSLPASNLEKWMAKLLINVILVPAILIISYQIGMYLIDWIIWSAFGIELVNYNFLTTFFQLPLVFIYYGLSVIFFWGSITFEKMSFFKTILLVLFCYFPLVIMFLFFFNIYIPELDGYWDILELDFSQKLKGYSIKDNNKPVTERTTTKILFGTLAATFSMLLASSYFRLKEKQA